MSGSKGGIWSKKFPQTTRNENTVSSKLSVAVDLTGETTKDHDFMGANTTQKDFNRATNAKGLPTASDEQTPFLGADDMGEQNVAFSPRTNIVSDQTKDTSKQIGEFSTQN